MNFYESSLSDLFQSTLHTFPKTTKRENVIDEIVISKLEWTPFFGMKTLRVKGLAQNKGNGHEYNPEIVFKNVQFYNTREVYGLAEIIDNTGDRFFIEKLSYGSGQVLIRCGCQDFRWRFNYADYLSKDLFGRKRKKYEALYNPGSANPENSKGMCKHLMKLMKVVGEAKLMKD